MLGESKFDVLNMVPDQYKPKTILIRYPFAPKQVLASMRENGFRFPVIFKPDIGERGFMVKRIFTDADVEEYAGRLKADFLVQEFVDLPVECGVFYTRFPNDETGKVTSLVLKEMLTVTGDGKTSLEELILDKPRAKLQWDVLKDTYRDRLGEIIPSGQVVSLNEIGNHCLGTKFLDGEKFISEKLSQTFDHISKQVNEFYFGRYDLRCASLEDLYEGNIKVMELNGCGAEPAHIYQPGYSLWKALKVLFIHWKNLFTISVQNHKRGVPYVSIAEGRLFYKKFKSVIQ